MRHVFSYVQSLRLKRQSIHQFVLPLHSRQGFKTFQRMRGTISFQLLFQVAECSEKGLIIIRDIPFIRLHHLFRHIGLFPVSECLPFMKQRYLHIGRIVQVTLPWMLEYSKDSYHISAWTLTRHLADVFSRLIKSRDFIPYFKILQKNPSSSLSKSIIMEHKVILMALTIKVACGGT